MPKDIHVPARIIGGKIPVRASLGQTVIVTEGPETYTGPVTVTPTESEQTLLTKDKLLTDNISVNPIPSEYVDAKADYDNALTAFGVEDNLADGINALTEYSNEITGEQDETLSDAVRSLADGYDDGSIVASLLDGSFEGVFNNDKITSGLNFAFRNCSKMTEVHLPNYSGTVLGYAFGACTNLRKVVIPNVKQMDNYAFTNSNNIKEYDVRNVEMLGADCIRGSGNMTAPIIFLKPLNALGNIIMSGIWSDVRLCQIPTKILDRAFRGTTVIDLYVSWSEGEVSGYPWGGTIQNIHYNTVFDSEGNIISST